MCLQRFLSMAEGELDMAANPFAVAQKNASIGIKSKPQDPNVIDPEDPEIKNSIDQFIKAKTQEKEAKAAKEVAASSVKVFAKDVFFGIFAKDGAKPEKNLTINGNKGSIKFIVQDRGNDERYYIADEQLIILRQLLGQALEDDLVEYTKFSFDPTILNKPGVMDAFGACIANMVESDVLSQNDANSLLSAREVRTVKKGTVAKLAKLCGNKKELMEQVFQCLGSTVSAYIR